MEIDVIFYDLPDGSEPVREFLNSLDIKMRAKVGSDISRVLYFFYVGGKAILTHGFIKKTQKTPSAEKNRAMRYRAEYLNREAK